jgi:RND family efflux transporter MFP subunit
MRGIEPRIDRWPPVAIMSGKTMTPDRRILDELRIERKAPSRGLPWFLLLVVLVILASAAIGAVWWFNGPKPTVVNTSAAREVTLAGGGTDRTLLNASGYVTARREATVSSKVTGKVTEVMVEEGMKVDAGQVLARIDSSNVERSLRLAEAQLESARAALGETKANLAHAQREWERRVAVGNAASQSDRDRAEADAKAYQARLVRQMAEISVAEGEVAVWKQQEDDTIIRAPFPGIVTTKNAQPGEMISPMSVGGFTRTGICTIVDMSSLEIEVDVSESYINRVEPAQPVEATLDAYPNWRIPGKVIAIIPTADRQKATVKVRIGFEKLDPRILPDMSVKVAFQSAAPTTAKSVERAVVIPKAAVRQQDGRDIVWVVRDGRVERRAVTVASTGADEVSIAAGLSAGERVVADKAEGLVDGARVTVEER